MDPNAREFIRKLVRPDLIGFIYRAVASFTFLWLFLQFSDVALDGLQKDILKPTSLEKLMHWAEGNQRLYMFLSLIICSVTLLSVFELFAAVVRTVTRESAPQTGAPQISDPYEAIVSYAASLNRKNHFDHFFRVYDVFSRHLWLEGRLETRVRLGKCAEEAATKAGDDSRLIQVLIDDLGWTNVALRNYGAAKESIDRGVSKAIALSFPFWAAKGLRHLAGIATLEHDHEESLKKLIESEAIANSLSDSSKKSEMLTGIEYAKATTLLRQRKPFVALISIERFAELAHQSGDKTRLVRVYAIKGQAYLLANKWADAKEAFIRGLKAAEEMGRADEVIRNHRGLMECCKHFGEIDQMEAHFVKVKELEGKTPVPFEIEAR